MQKANAGNEIVCLISVFSENKESYMFHTPNISIVSLQAKAINLPIIRKATEGVKEKELDDLRDVIADAVRLYGIEGIVTGALASNYQRERIQKLCDRLGISCVNPLWGTDQVKVLNELVDLGFEVMISGVFAYPLGEDLLGARLDKKIIGELTGYGEKYGINPAGEGGEIETTVLDAPFFKKKIVVLDYEKMYRNNAGTYSVLDAKLADK